MNELTTYEPRTVSVFSGVDSFELAQRMAGVLVKSDLVPQQFRGNLANCIIALELAQRIDASPLAVMQQTYIVHGRPSWSSQFIIAALNSCGRFSPLRYDMQGQEGTDDRSCAVWCHDLKNGNERLEGPRVSIRMAKAEGWFSKSGSKWQTMPELMLRYRAATFFGRLYAPDILMGMRAEEEMQDAGEQKEQAFIDMGTGEVLKPIRPAAQNTTKNAAETTESGDKPEDEGKHPRWFLEDYGFLLEADKEKLIAYRNQELPAMKGKVTDLRGKKLAAIIDDLIAGHDQRF